MRRKLLLFFGALFALFLVIQLTNFLPAFAHTNPQVTYPIEWDSPRTEELIRNACFDCHSNETVWPWYSNIAPVSWLVVRDVNEGREELNFSTNHRIEVDEIIETILEGEMPPPIYLPTHPEANLSEAEKDQLIAGVRATFSGSSSGEDHDDDEPEDHDDDD